MAPILADDFHIIVKMIDDSAQNFLEQNFIFFDGKEFSTKSFINDSKCIFCFKCCC